MNTIHSHRIHIPIYGGVLIIYSVVDFTEIEKIFEFDLQDKFGAITWHRNKTFYAAFMVDYITPENIAHEAKHIINKIFADRGILLDPTNDEPECYLLGWIVKEIYKGLHIKIISTLNETK
jgi:hypothetical protein